MLENLEAFQKIKKDLKSLQVGVNVEYKDQHYYITLDGSKTYNDPRKWDNWNGFDFFAKTMLSSITNIEPIMESPTKAVFTLGSVLDILKDVQ